MKTEDDLEILTQLMPSARMAAIMGIFLQLWTQYRSQSSVQEVPAPTTTAKPQVLRASRVRTTSQLEILIRETSLTEQQRYRRAQRPDNVREDETQLYEN